MQLRRSRRIFRPGPPVRARRVGAAVGVAAVLGAGVAGLSLWRPRPLQIIASPPPGAHGTLSATAPEVAVVDGDTLRLNQTVLRLHGVVAPPRGRACHGQDGASYDCGAAASQALAGIVRGQAVACRLAGRDPQGFAQADCRAGPTDVNRAIVAAGWAHAVGPGELASVEDAARAAGRGAWHDTTNESF